MSESGNEGGISPMKTTSDIDAQDRTKKLPTKKYGDIISDVTPKVVTHAL